MLHNLRTALAEKKINQTKWARKVGISETDASRIIAGLALANKVVRRRTAKLLDADEGWLFDATPPTIPRRIKSDSLEQAEQAEAH